MGHIISAKCECGYAVPDIRIGSGELQLGEICWHPALCRKCKKLVTVNILADRIRCPRGRCREVPQPYFNTPGLQETPSNFFVSQWDGLKLNDGAYLCPECDNYSLRFSWPHILFD